MNRLATRLLLAFLAVALLSSIAVPALQSIAARRTFSDLSPEFRGRIERSLPRRGVDGPPPFVRNERPPNGPLTDRQRPNGQLPEGQVPDEGFLREENTRLLELLGDYRAAQRQAVAFGVGGTVLLSVSLALLLSRTIARPIEAVSRAASELAAGDLTARVNLGRSYPADETRARSVSTGWPRRSPPTRVNAKR